MRKNEVDIAEHYFYIEAMQGAALVISKRNAVQRGAIYGHYWAL